MRFLYICFVSLIILLNIGLAFAFHDGGESFYGPEDGQARSIDPSRPLAQPEFIGGGDQNWVRGSSGDSIRSTGTNGQRGYWENVPLDDGGYQEGQYTQRWVSVDDSVSGSGGGGRLFEEIDRPFQNALSGSGQNGISGFGGDGIRGFGGDGISGSGGGSFQITNPLGGIDTIQKLVDRLIDALIVLATPIVIIMVLWGSFKIMTSAGDPKTYKLGGEIILWAAVGYGILLLAKGVTAIIESIVYDIV